MSFQLFTKFRIILRISFRLTQGWPLKMHQRGGAQTEFKIRCFLLATLNLSRAIIISNIYGK
jgi:hypothetical protein